MRTLRIALGGLVAGAGLLSAGLAIDGLLGASLVMIAFATTTVAAGAAIAASSTVHRLATASRIRTPRTKTHRGRPIRRCICCGGTRRQLGELWICTACDLGATPLHELH